MACSSPELPQSTETVTQSQAIGNDDLSAVYKAYLDLKDALVATDGKTAQAKAQVLFEALEDVPVDYSAVWTQQMGELVGQAEAIAGTKDIKTQRAAFDKLSAGMIVLAEAHPVEDLDLYQQHCPMAFDNRGADWLSGQKQIANPYYGDMMLRCGSLKGQLSD